MIPNTSSLRYFHANETQTIPITFMDFMLRLFYFVEFLCLFLSYFFFSFAKSNVPGNRGHGIFSKQISVYLIGDIVGINEK